MGTKNGNIQLTANEQAEHDAAQATAQADSAARAVVIAQKATDKASGNQKLLDLGLTQAEVDATTG